MRVLASKQSAGGCPQKGLAMLQVEKLARLGQPVPLLAAFRRNPLSPKEADRANIITLWRARSYGRAGF